MTNGSIRKVFYSRLARREEKSNLRKAGLFTLLTIILLVLLIFLGIPLMTKIAIFLSDLQGISTPIEQNDTLSPTPPRFNSLPEYTKEPTLSLSGFAEPGSNVEIFLNGSPIGTIVTTAEGTFNFSKITLAGEKNEIYATATDEAGNKSQSSNKNIIIFDNTPPKLEINQPQEGQTFTGPQKRKIKIEGQTESSVTLMINERLIILEAEGKFSTDYSLQDGENVIKISAQDLAGNQTEKEFRVLFSP